MKVAVRNNSKVEFIDVEKDYHYCTTLTDGMASNTNIFLLEDDSVIIETKILNNGIIIDNWDGRYSKDTFKVVLSLLNKIKFK